MGDLGLGSLVAKFEEYFGRRATGALLSLVFVALVATATSFIWKNAVLPLVQLAAPLFPQAFSFTSFLGGLGIAIPMIGAIGAASIALDAYRRRLATDELEELVPKARELVDQSEGGLARLQESISLAQKTADDAMRMFKDTHAIYALSQMTFEDVIDAALNSGRLSEDQAAALRALAREVGEPPRAGLLSDAELLNVFQHTDGEPGNPVVDALCAEIERRGLDI